MYNECKILLKKLRTKEILAYDLHTYDIKYISFVSRNYCSNKIFALFQEEFLIFCQYKIYCNLKNNFYGSVCVCLQVLTLVLLLFANFYLKATSI